MWNRIRSQEHISICFLGCDRALLPLLLSGDAIVVFCWFLISFRSQRMLRQAVHEITQRTLERYPQFDSQLALDFFWFAECAAPTVERKIVNHIWGLRAKCEPTLAAFMEIEIKLFFDVVPFSPAQERAAVALDLCGSINSVSMEPISLCDARQMQKIASYASS